MTTATAEAPVIAATIKTFKRKIEEIYEGDYIVQDGFAVKVVSIEYSFDGWSEDQGYFDYYTIEIEYSDEAAEVVGASWEIIAFRSNEYVEKVA